MKIITTMMAGAVVALLSWMQSAQAQGSPQGSYLQRRNEAETAEQRIIKRRLQHGYRDPTLA